jgi:hypothetical protein
MQRVIGLVSSNKGAKERIQRDQHILAKKERNEVERWISKFRNN